MQNYMHKGLTGDSFCRFHFYSFIFIVVSCKNKLEKKNRSKDTNLILICIRDEWACFGGVEQLRGNRRGKLVEIQVSVVGQCRRPTLSCKMNAISVGRADCRRIALFAWKKCTLRKIFLDICDGWKCALSKFIRLLYAFLCKLIRLRN